MGKLFNVTFNLYADSNFSTLAGSISNIHLGISVGNAATVSFTNIANNFTFFTNRLNTGEDIFLGGSFIIPSGQQVVAAKIPSKWFPLCVVSENSMWLRSRFLEIVFSNDYKIRRPWALSSTGNNRLYFYDNNNHLLGNTTGVIDIYVPQITADGRPDYTTLVVSALNADGTIPDNARMAEYGLSGTFGSEMWGYANAITGANLTLIRNFFNAIPAYVEDPDPYANAGETEEGGGSGSFDYTGDTIPEPSLPTVGAASTGFISLFNPSATQLQSLMDYLWSPLFDLDTIKRLYADPMQQFVGLSLVPVPVPSSGSKTIQVGGVSTGIVLTAASAQFVSVDCGSITFNSSSLTASYLDFLPYTKTQLYLPYIGIVDVSTDDIMDKTMSIKYHVDILTGGCIAYIIVGGSVMYQYSGQCAINVPLTSVDWSNTISSALNLVSSAMHGIVAGASVPLSGGLGALTGIGAAANMGASAVNAATNMKPTISKSGAIGGSSGIMAVQKPFLIVTCPNLARAKKQDYYVGYPSFITKNVADCDGFCSFEEIYLSGLGLTDEEMKELSALMKEGVYL